MIFKNDRKIDINLLILYLTSLISFLLCISIFLRAYIHNNIPVGWDTPHYISLVKIIQEQGFVSFLQHQKFTYIFYPIMEYCISALTKISIFNLEKGIPIVIVACIIIMVGLVINKWFDDLKLALLGITFSSFWFLLYRFGADLHANLFAVLLSLVLLYFYYDFKKGDNLIKKIIVPTLLLLIGLTHIETAVFFFGIISLDYLLTTRKHNLKRNILYFLILAFSISIPIILSISQSTQILQPVSLPVSVLNSQGPELSFLHWFTSLGFFNSFFVILGVIYLINLLWKMSYDKYLFLLIWIFVVVVTGIGSYFTPALLRYAYRVTFLFPVPFIACFGFYFLYLIIYKNLEIKPLYLSILIIGLVFTSLISASSFNSQAKTHLKPFVSQGMINDLGYIKTNLKLDKPPMFIVNDRDNVAGRVAQNRDNWIQSVLGDHFIYVGKLNYFLRVSPTYYNDGLTKYISGIYIANLNDNGIFNYDSFKNYTVIVMPDFNLRLNNIEKSYLNEVRPGIFVLNPDMLENPLPTLKIDPAYESISSKGNWYVINRTWADNGYVMEIYEPQPSLSDDPYYITYGFSLQNDSQVKLQLLYFDYETSYSPITLKLDNTEVKQILYEGTLEPYTFSYQTNLTKGDHNLKFSVDSNKSVMVNLNYIYLDIT